jgi:hypothetical protein
MPNHQPSNPQSPNLLSLIAAIISPHLKTKHKDTISMQLAQQILDTYRDYDPS